LPTLNSALAGLPSVNDLLLRAARGERTERPPVWLMRQAGRHLPEYRELRAEHSFREAIETPEIAAEITLQPWERYRPDGLVIFSDILVALEPLGFEYHVESGVGPVIEHPIEGPGDVDRPRRTVRDTLGFVGDLLARLEDEVGDEVPLIGFAGGPFTLASYAIAGGSSRNQLPARRFRVEHPDAFRELLGALAGVVREHLAFQIDAGADVVQLFDTYAGVLSPADYREFVLPLHREILDGLDAPTIVFVRNMGGNLDLLAEAGADIVSLDWRVGMAAARAELGDHPVQGNLDPTDLFGSPAFVRERTRELIEKAGPEGHVLNLGHGVHKDTPVDSVAAFVETAKSIER
jgi:uroporphyrinogen decarboxylase